jgi:hypothetical protein
MLPILTLPGLSLHLLLHFESLALITKPALHLLEQGPIRLVCDVVPAAACIDVDVLAIGMEVQPALLPWCHWNMCMATLRQSSRPASAREH